MKMWDKCRNWIILIIFKFKFTNDGGGCEQGWRNCKEDFDCVFGTEESFSKCGATHLFW